MATSKRNTLNWPALDLAGRSLPSRITFERGIWGKLHGAASDFRWLATTAGLAAPENHLENNLPLGSEDVPVKATLWRTIGDRCYAIAIDRSRAQDASGRDNFTEKQVLEWRRPRDVPAALGALLMLPFIASFEPLNWSGQRPDVNWSDDPIDLTAATIVVSLEEIDDAIEEGLHRLAESTLQKDLTQLYATLLAGGRAVSLRNLAAPLPPAAVAALLLPLPRNVADRISIAGWLPSSRVSASDADHLLRTWDLVLGGTTAVQPPAVKPTGEQHEQALAMARSVFARNPAVPVRATKPAAKTEAPTDDRKPLQLTMWGHSAAGKTALLATLYLEADHESSATPSPWLVGSSVQSLKFFQDMRSRMLTDNRFPDATSVGTVEGIEYVFQHRVSKSEAFLQLEDRPGKESEELPDEVKEGRTSLKERLISADGLVFVVDHKSPPKLVEWIWRTFEDLNATGTDSRPVAVCVTKADSLIRTPADFRRALDDPHEFAKKHVPPDVLRALERKCENYRLFPVSAAGVRLRRGVIEPVVFIDEMLKPRICPDARAFNLMAPFTWLLEQLTGHA